MSSKMNYELYQACKSNNLEQIKNLIQNGNCLDFKADVYGNDNTLLKYVIANFNFDIIKIFIECYANQGRITDLTETISYFIWNTTESNAKILKFLIEKGADSNVPQLCHGFTPLQVACQTKSNIQFIKTIIESGADLNVKSTNNQNLLHLALENENPSIDVIKFLLEKGVNLDSIDLKNKTPLQLACENKNVRIDIIHALVNNDKKLYEKVTGWLKGAAENNYNAQFVLAHLNRTLASKNSYPQAFSWYLAVAENGSFDIASEIQALINDENFLEFLISEKNSEGKMQLMVLSDKIHHNKSLSQQQKWLCFKVISEKISLIEESLTKAEKNQWYFYSAENKLWLLRDKTLSNEERSSLLKEIIKFYDKITEEDKTLYPLAQDQLFKLKYKADPNDKDLFKHLNAIKEALNDIKQTGSQNQNLLDLCEWYRDFKFDEPDFKVSKRVNKVVQNSVNFFGSNPVNDNNSLIVNDLSAEINIESTNKLFAKFLDGTCSKFGFNNMMCKIQETADTIWKGKIIPFANDLMRFNIKKHTDTQNAIFLFQLALLHYEGVKTLDIDIKPYLENIIKLALDTKDISDNDFFNKTRNHLLHKLYLLQISSVINTKISNDVLLKRIAPKYQVIFFGKITDTVNLVISELLDAAVSKSRFNDTMSKIQEAADEIWKEKIIPFANKLTCVDTESVIFLFQLALLHYEGIKPVGIDVEPYMDDIIKLAFDGQNIAGNALFNKTRNYLLCKLYLLQASGAINIKISNDDLFKKIEPKYKSPLYKKYTGIIDSIKVTEFAENKTEMAELILEKNCIEVQQLQRYLPEENSTVLSHKTNELADSCHNYHLAYEDEKKADDRNKNFINSNTQQKIKKELSILNKIDAGLFASLGFKAEQINSEFIKSKELKENINAFMPVIDQKISKSKLSPEIESLCKKYKIFTLFFRKKISTYNNLCIFKQKMCGVASDIVELRNLSLQNVMKDAINPENLHKIIEEKYSINIEKGVLQTKKEPVSSKPEQFKIEENMLAHDFERPTTKTGQKSYTNGENEPIIQDFSNALPQNNYQPSYRQGK